MDPGPDTTVKLVTGRPEDACAHNPTALVTRWFPGFGKFVITWSALSPVPAKLTRYAGSFVLSFAKVTCPVCEPAEAGKKKMTMLLIAPASTMGGHSTTRNAAASVPPVVTPLTLNTVSPAFVIPNTLVKPPPT